jgi:Skp family chaperone for outer membrane proteins
VIQSKLSRICAVSATVLFPLSAVAQQQGPGWFVPGQQRPAAGPAAQPNRAPAPAPAPGFTNDGLIPSDDQQGLPRQIQLPLPPMPEIPEIAKGTPPPPPVIGILSVPDIMRLSVAYQAAYRELGARDQKLNEDAQKEQVALRELGQGLVRDRAKMKPEEIRAKEREYEERINESRRKFGERKRILQEAHQYVVAQIDRTLEAVTQKVAVSRGVTLVLNRAQILGTTFEYDLSPQVAEILNKVQPTVVVPPDGISVMSMVPSGASAPGSITAAPAPTEQVPLVVPAAPAKR